MPAQPTLPHTPWQVTYSQLTRAVDETTSAVKKSVDDSPLGAAKLKVSRPHPQRAPRVLFCTHPNTRLCRACACVCMHACMYTCTCMHACTHAHACMHACMHMHDMHVCLYRKVSDALESVRKAATGSGES